MLVEIGSEIGLSVDTKNFLDLFKKFLKFSFNKDFEKMLRKLMELMSSEAQISFDFQLPDIGRSTITSWTINS